MSDEHAAADAISQLAAKDREIAQLRSVMGSVRRYIITHGRIAGAAGSHKQAILAKIDAVMSKRKGAC